MSSRVILITGANAGLGKSTAQQLAIAGEFSTILIGSRDTEKGKKTAKEISNSLPSDNRTIVEQIDIDVRSDESIAQAAQFVDRKYGKLDVLVNNAGIQNPDVEYPKRDVYHNIYDTNVFGPVIVTNEFLPLLKKAKEKGNLKPRVVFVTSNMGSLNMIADPNSVFWIPRITPYRASKSALNMIMLCYSKQLSDEGIVIGAVCPGYCDTQGFNGYLPAEQGGATIIKAINASEEDAYAKVIDADGYVPW